MCNGCRNESKCQLEKHFYYAKDSQQEYETLLSTARSGFVIEEEEAELRGVLRKGLSNGHSVYHIIQSVGEESIGYSSKTISSMPACLMASATSTCHARYVIRNVRRAASRM